MTRSFVLKAALLLAAALTGQASPSFAASPVILPVDGLYFPSFGCEESVFNDMLRSGGIKPIYNLHLTACLALKHGAPMMENGQYSRGYLRNMLKNVCGGSCGALGEYYWDRDIKNSREAVDGLKLAIMSHGIAAKETGRPFIIVAHSWGGVLTGQALAELGDSLPFRVNKVVTVGTPLGGMMYSAAVTAMIASQGFYNPPRAAPSVDLWVNYWAGRDMISSPLKIEGMKIINYKLDGEESFAVVTDRLLKESTNPGAGHDRLAALDKDLAKMVIPRSTFLWHDVYFTPYDIDLPSVGERIMTDWMIQSVKKQISSAD